MALFWKKWKAIFHGRKDGKEGYPSDDSVSPSLYEDRRISDAEAQIRYLRERYERADKKLKEQYCMEKVTLENLNDKIKALEKEHQEAREDHKDKRKITEKSRLPVPVPISYWIIFAVLAMCEFPMNSVVFDILGEAKWLTYLLAAGLGVIIPLAAHFLGIQLRRESFFESLPGACKAMLMIIIVMAVLISIAYIREKFVEGSKIATLLGISMDPRMVTIVFLSINLLIFMVATIASNFYHIDVGDEIKREDYHVKRIIKESRKILNELSEDLESLREAKDKIEESISKISVARGNLFDQYVARANNVQKTTELLISIYRHENMRSRMKAGKGSKEPLSFQKDPDIDIGIFAGKLDEDCGEQV
ncbi:MAG: hypothetical protein QW358_04865 [Candidatus Hadarchaeum sp.]